MSLDLFGPASAANSVTSRPDESRSFGAADTFWRDCSSPELDDGTEWQAGPINQIVANLRALARGNGLTGAAAQIVAEDNSDDLLLWKTVQHLVQRNQPKYAVDSGTADHVVVALSPALAEYKNGIKILSIVAADNTGATDMNVNGLGAVPVVLPDGSALSKGFLLAGQPQEFMYYNGAFRLVWAQRQPGAPIYLAASTDFYVGGPGASDSNDGLSATLSGGHGPWATMQKASDYITRFNLNGFDINIHCYTTGTFAPVALSAISGAGNVNWIGNAGSPGSCLIDGNGTAKTCISAGDCGRAHNFNGFKVRTSGSFVNDPMLGLHVYGSGTRVAVKNMDYGACPGGHISCEQAATLIESGTKNISGGCAGSVGGNGGHTTASTGGQIQTSPSVVLTIPSAVSFAAAFAGASMVASLQELYSSVTGAGNVTAQRFNVATNAVISTNGGGANYFPGTSVGSQATGGQYI